MAADLRRELIVAIATKFLLLTTFVIAYLNAILRPTVESGVTLFRILLPLVAGFCLIRFLRWPQTRYVLLYLFIALTYCLVQIGAFGLFGSATVWSFLVNILALGLFVYFIALYLDLYGRGSLLGHLYFWYGVLILLSTHQLLTGFQYPIVPYREDVARIFFGQENDTSLALAAFFPLLFERLRRDPIALGLLIVGLVIIYINSTRGILVAVAAYPLLLAATALISRVGRRAAPLRPIILVLAVVIVAVALYVLKDVRISMIGDENGSLGELVLDPLTEILRGQRQDAELTSINVRVTLVLVGMQSYLSTFGIGVGPGAFQQLGEALYPDIAASMHVFPLQMLTELGWLYVGLMVWIVRAGVRREGWAGFLPKFVYYNMVTLSMSAGAISNYYFLACAAFVFLAKAPERAPAPQGSSH